MCVRQIDGWMLWMCKTCNLACCWSHIHWWLSCVLCEQWAQWRCVWRYHWWRWWSVVAESHHCPWSAGFTVVHLSPSCSTSCQLWYCWVEIVVRNMFDFFGLFSRWTGFQFQKVALKVVSSMYMLKSERGQQWGCIWDKCYNNFVPWSFWSCLWSC